MRGGQLPPPGAQVRRIGGAVEYAFDLRSCGGPVGLNLQPAVSNRLTMTSAWLSWEGRVLSRLAWVVEKLVPDGLWEWAAPLLLPSKPRRHRHPTPLTGRCARDCCAADVAAVSRGDRVVLLV